MTEPTCARTHTHTRTPPSHFKRTLANRHNTSCRLWKSHSRARQRVHKHKRCDVSLVHKRTHCKAIQRHTLSLKWKLVPSECWGFRWISLCWVQIHLSLRLIHTDGPEITPQSLAYCIAMPRCMYNCSQSTYTNTLRLPHGMSKAPVSVLNCNGPCQIKGKVFLCPPSNSINIPSAMNS